MEDIFLVAALAAKRTEGSQDAIDKCITMTATQGYGINFDLYEEEDFVPFDPRIKRTESTIRNKQTGETFKCTKGAPQVILALAEDESIVEDVSRNVEELASRGYRTLGVAKTDKNGKWSMLGLVPLYDPPREDTAETIQKAIQMEVSVKMITGDQTAIAKETARLLKMGDRIYNSELLSETASETQRQLLDSIIEEADGFAEVFPEHKFAIVKHLQDKGHRVGMTGDGVNDAPALKKADVGIAVDGATDAARAAADIVLTSPGLSVIIEAIFRSRKIFQRMKNYCIYRIACTIQLLIFFFTTMCAINPQNYTCIGHDDCDRIPNTFSLPVLALVIITLLNDGTIISIAYDQVTVSKKPEKWNLPIIFIISTLQGGVAYVSSLIALLVSLNNLNINEPNPLISAFGVQSFSYGELLTVIYLKVAVSDFLTIYASRTTWWFWSRRASKILNLAFVIATMSSSILALTWSVDISTGDKATTIPPMQALSFRVVFLIWLLDIVFFLVQDVTKVLSFQMLEKYYKLTNPTKEVFSSHYLTDTFLVFTTGYDKGGAKRSIVTRRSMAAAKAGSS
jgi:H+-transporting ATPase